MHRPVTLIFSLPDVGSSMEVPTEFQLFPAGAVEVQGGEPILVDVDAIARVIRSFESRGLDMVIDYEHQTEGGEFSSPDGRAPAAGWVKGFEDRGAGGLWATGVVWTTRAAEYLRNREYRYFSPVVLTTTIGRRLVDVLRIALTNAPRITNLRPIVNKAAHTGEPCGGPQPVQMEGLMDFLVLCARKVGLDEKATGEEVLAALDRVTARAGDGGDQPACPEVLTALGLSGTAARSEIIATAHALRQKPDLTMEVASLRRRLAERDRDELVSAAVRQGKITPAQREWADEYALKDPEGFRIFIAKAVTVVPIGETNPPPAQTDDPRHGVDDAQLQVNRLMGIDIETFRKFAPQG